MIEPLPAIVFPYTFVISVAFVRQHKTIQIMCHLAVIALARYLNKIDTVSPFYCECSDIRNDEDDIGILV